MFFSPRSHGLNNVSRTARKLTAWLLVFLFVVTPLHGLLAEEIAPEVLPIEPIESVEPEGNAIEAPIEEISPEEIPAEEINPDEEKKEEEPKEEEPELDAIVSPTGERTEITAQKKARLSADIDSLTGAFTYSYDIIVPPGRLEMTPGIALTYTSANAKSDSIIGSGWDINIPYIQRMNKTGSNNLYTENNYVSSLDGELISLGSGLYGAKDENGSFLKYQLSSNVWTVTDKGGTVYTFGNTASARQDNPSDSTKIYKWMLQEMRDTNDNYISYEYYKDAGQIYPSKITYTGNGSTPGILEVNFDRSSRSNASAFYTTGFSVKSNYRITEIRTEVNDVWARKYTLDYITGDTSSGSLLDTITESGRDSSGTVISLPAMNFDYQTASSPGWTYDSSWSLPIPLMYNGVDSGTRMADINGDGLLDLLCHNDKTSSNVCPRSTPKIYLNNGSGWTDVSSTWVFPAMADIPSKLEGFLDSGMLDTGLRLLDVNGDNLADLVRGYGSSKYTYINNGSGWTYTSSWNPPLAFYPEYGIRTADINGDGLLDFLCHNDATSGNICPRSAPKIYLNNGNGWTDVSSTWLFPAQADVPSKLEAFLESGMTDMGLRLFDVNGDGLTDLVRGQGNSAKFTYLNNGSGWTYTSSWNPPLYVFNDYGTRNEDINGDGLVDYLCHNNKTNGTLCPRSGPLFYLNNGNGWTDVSSTWLFPARVDTPSYKEYFLDDGYVDVSLRTADINGDGLADMLRSWGTSSNFSLAYLYVNNQTVPINLLKAITYPQGGQSAITYKATPLFKDGSTALNPNLPLTLHVVSQISTSDGLGNTEQNTYQYEGGRYYFNTPLDRKMAGFNKITKTNSAGDKTITYYHQGNTSDSSNGEYSDHVSKIGKAYRTEVKNGAGDIYAKTINKWDRYDLGSGRSFVKLAQTLDMTYDGDSDHADKAVAYTYENTYGNVTETVEYGSVNGSNDGSFSDTGSDKLITSISYASNTTPYIVGLPSQETTVDNSSVKVHENKYYYDTQTFGGVTDGNLTKQEMWKTGSTYIDTEKTYNSYGLVTQEKDPRDKTTTYGYDSYNLYPTTVTNALSQTNTYIYDYSSGTPISMTDQNSRVFEDVYDGFDRLIEEKQPDLTTPSTLVTKTTYAYTDTSGAVKVQQTNYLDASTSVTMYTYFDGLGRPIQVRNEVEDSNTYAITDTIYNAIGQVYKESLPYSSTGSARTTATTTAALLSTKTYDPMMRVISIVNAVGTTSNVYDDWKTTITDPRSNNKDIYSDAFGNLVRVDEHDDSSTYTTTYEYNGNKNLVKITDALGNIRNFTFDGLGRRLTAEDLHAVGDATFGTWTYGYDDSGNMTSIVNPNGQTVNYTYDDTNRQLTENYTGQIGTEVTYAYDSGTDGIGRLSSITAASANTAYLYDPLGNMKRETKTIDLTAYQTDSTYDRQGNQLEITNPDGSKVKYAYNTAGQLETVQRKESSDGSFINVITDFDYGPHGQITYQAFANGASTTNTYDATKLYRLSDKVTSITGGDHIQELTYTYDANGNITKIVDASDTDSAKTVDYTYDDLNRLLSATATSVADGQTTYTHEYTYNALGNILTRSDVEGIYSYDGDEGSNYANPHAVTSIGEVEYTYDANGNLLTETDGLSNTWDYNNRLTQTVKGGITSIYTYDQGGSRMKLDNGTVITYSPTDTYSTDGTTATKHIFANGQMVATVTGTGGGAAVYSDHTDHLTGANAITNSGGTLEEVIDYFPFGNIRLDEKAGSFDQQRKYAGHEYDADTGLSYMEARYYNAGMGRWMSQDPVFLSASDSNTIESKTNKPYKVFLADPQGLNSYSYVKNNPLRYVDPTGEDWIDTIFNIDQKYNPFTLLFEPGFSGMYYGYKNRDLKQFAHGLGTVVTNGVLVAGTALEIGMAVGETAILYQRFAALRGIVDSGGFAVSSRNINFAAVGNRTSIQNLNRHWSDHRLEFPQLRNAIEYDRAAKDFIVNQPANTLYKTLTENRAAYYNERSNTLVITDNGSPATMFRPTEGRSYYNRLK